MNINIEATFCSIERAKRAEIVSSLLKDKKPFALVLKTRKVLFNPETLQAMDLPSKQTYSFVHIDAMKMEVIGLLYVAIDVLIPKKQIDNQNLLS